MDDAGEEYDEDTVRKVAAAFARRGHTGARLREESPALGGEPFWGDVAAELDALEARQRLRVIVSPGARTPYRR
jgi:hypothetical protein